ncbi:MAG: glycerate kinase [Actinobacteria bacterium]|nr:glycerate kinase [Actinomycetota bacterium]
MRILIAPDSFKGTLTAPAAAAAIADGWRTRRPDDDLDLCPLSDGGDGLLEVVGATGGWSWQRATVEDPARRLVTARWLRRGDAVVVETAEACGLHLLAEDERTPTRWSTYGVGQLLQAAATDGAGEVYLGLGGSGTSDGGIGLLAALGADLRDGDGRPVGADGARDLARVATARPATSARWRALDLVVVSDVTTPLLDAARVFGPQKGATATDVVSLTAGLRRLADAVETGFDLPGLRERPGTGAAGGLGFALAALGARIVDGARHVADLVGLRERLAAADLVIVGEGRLDATSLQGKVVGATVAMAEELGVPLAAVVGRADLRPAGFAALEEASPGGPGTDPAADLRSAAARLAECASRPRKA